MICYHPSQQSVNEVKQESPGGLTCTIHLVSAGLGFLSVWNVLNAEDIYGPNLKVKLETKWKERKCPSETLKESKPSETMCIFGLRPFSEAAGAESWKKLHDLRWTCKALNMRIKGGSLGRESTVWSRGSNRREKAASCCSGSLWLEV